MRPKVWESVLEAGPGWQLVGPRRKAALKGLNHSGAKPDIGQ